MTPNQRKLFDLGQDAGRAFLAASQDAGWTFEQRTTVTTEIAKQAADAREIGIPAQWHDGFLTATAE